MAGLMELPKVNDIFVLGLDLGTTSFGMGWWRIKDGEIVSGEDWHNKVVKSKLISKTDMLKAVRDEVESTMHALYIIDEYSIVFYEGFAYQGKGTFPLAMEFGVLSVLLEEKFERRMWAVQPATIKKWIAGKGKLEDKGVVRLAAAQRYGYKSLTDWTQDEIDAYCLAELGAYCVSGIEPPTKYQQECVKTVLTSKLNK